MAVCSSGISRPKAGVTQVAVFAAGASTLAGALPKYNWVLYALGLLGNIAVETATFCAVDPPTQPTFTQAEYDAFLAVSLDANYWSFLSKLKDAAYNAIWYTLCECASVATPAIPDLPPPPSTTTFTNVSNPSGPCCSVTTQDIILNAFTSTIIEPFIRWDGGQFAPPGCPTPVQRNGTSVRFRAVNTVTTAPGFTGVIQLFIFTRPNTTSSTLRQTYNVTPGQNFDVLFEPLNTNDYQLFVTTGVGSGGGASRMTLTYDLYCDGQKPGIPQTSCCPPDTTVTAMLDHLVKQVDLIQRQEVPFAFVHGTVHNGLINAGEFAVQGIAGLLLTLTTVPTLVGTDIGDPNTLWNAGTVSVRNVDGWQPRQWISASPQIFVPRYMGAMTRVGYSLRPGVVATITELLREP